MDGGRFVANSTHDAPNDLPGSTGFWVTVNATQLDSGDLTDWPQQPLR